MSCIETFESLVLRYRTDDAIPFEGYSASLLDEVEARLSVRLPRSLRTFYVSVGRVRSLFEVHNRVRPPQEIVFEDGYIVFMDENQAVVSWGMRPGQETEDPDVWQRVNGAYPTWYSEGKTLAGLLESMLSWYRHVGVL